MFRAQRKSGNLDDIISDDNRAGEVLHRMRGLLKRKEAKFETVDLNEVIVSTLQLLHSELINRRVKITCAFDESLPLVYGDRVQLQQVLLNLVINAADSMNDQTPSRRIMVIGTRSLGEGDIEITVADQAPAFLPRNKSVFFNRSSPPRNAAWDLGCRYAHRSSRLMAESSNLRTIRREALRRHSPYRIRLESSERMRGST